MKLNNNDDSHNSGLNLLIYNMLLDIESHPAWVCGLKLLNLRIRVFAFVTPCVGVWIETHETFDKTSRSCPSHPAWVCGLKHITKQSAIFFLVTPCVGVWIETPAGIRSAWHAGVTPCVGVWIETLFPCP